MATTSHVQRCRELADRGLFTQLRASRLLSLAVSQPSSDVAASRAVMMLRVTTLQLLVSVGATLRESSEVQEEVLHTVLSTDAGCLGERTLELINYTIQRLSPGGVIPAAPAILFVVNIYVIYTCHRYILIMAENTLSMSPREKSVDNDYLLIHFLSWRFSFPFFGASVYMLSTHLRLLHSVIFMPLSPVLSLAGLKCPGIVEN